MPERFDFEMNRTLFGRNHTETQWERPAFSALVEAVETLAIQRNIERWTPVVRTAAATGPTPRVSHGHLGGRVVPEPLIIRDSEEIGRRAFKTALPMVGRLAAGPFFDGFATGALTAADDLDWVAVSPTLCGKNRFVVRVAGDSMEPLFHIGDLLVFEYHRTPRQDGQIVIAADFTTGEDYAIKRFQADPTHWCFVSENPAHATIKIPKDEMPEYPILGTFVARVVE